MVRDFVVLRLVQWMVVPVCWVIAVMGSVANAQDDVPSDIQTVLARYRQILLDDPRVNDDGAVEGYVEKISEEGIWPDIDYRDRSRAGWGPEKHLSRIREIAKSYFDSHSEFYKNPTALMAVDRGIDHWNQHRYRSLNWWYNEIGVPRTMRDIVVLLGDKISGERRENSIEVIRQFKLKGTGANLLWSAEIAVHYACLTNHPEEVAIATERIWSEIQVGQKAGIQADWSFFQHGRRLQLFSYGKAFIEIAVKTSWQMRETPWAIPDAKRSILSTYLFEGVQWMVRGRTTVASTMDRQFARKDRLKWGDMRQLFGLWLEVDPDHRDLTEELIARQNGTALPLVGHRHFRVADFTVYHRPAGSIFLKTLSTRTSPTETTNSENLKGKRYLHSGDHYVVRDGKEIEGLQPVLDWARLPGITIADRQTIQEQRSFVGGISDGASGLTSMDYARELDGATELEVRKSWFFHHDMMICLMGGFQTEGIAAPMVTSLEQCHLRGDVWMKDESGDSKRSLSEQPIDARWVIHHEIGYLSLGGQSIQVSGGEQSGTWKSINRKFRNEDTIITEQVFRVSLDHGLAPEPTGYAIILEATPDRLAALSTTPTWTVLKNNSDCQSIQFENGLVMASFFEPGTVEVRTVEIGLEVGLEVGKGNAVNTLTVDQPCLVMVSRESLRICDPTHQGLRVNVAWKGRQVEIELAPGGETQDYSRLFD